MKKTLLVFAFAAFAVLVSAFPSSAQNGGAAQWNGSVPGRVLGSFVSQESFDAMVDEFGWDSREAFALAVYFPWYAKGRLHDKIHSPGAARSASGGEEEGGGGRGGGALEDVVFSGIVVTNFNGAESLKLNLAWPVPSPHPEGWFPGGMLDIFESTNLLGRYHGYTRHEVVESSGGAEVFVAMGGGPVKFVRAANTSSSGFFPYTDAYARLALGGDPEVAALPDSGGIPVNFAGDEQLWKSHPLFANPTNPANVVITQSSDIAGAGGEYRAALVLGKDGDPGGRLALPTRGGESWALRFPADRAVAFEFANNSGKPANFAASAPPNPQPGADNPAFAVSLDGLAVFIDPMGVLSGSGWFGFVSFSLKEVNTGLNRYTACPWPKPAVFNLEVNQSDFPWVPYVMAWETTGGTRDEIHATRQKLIPDANAEMAVLTAKFDTGKYYTLFGKSEAKAEIVRCSGSEYGSSVSGGFSPHLGETARIYVKLEPCPHEMGELWIEAEVTRQGWNGTKIEDQKICWIYLDPNRPGEKRVKAKGSFEFFWDGKATASANSRETVEVFLKSWGASESFRGVLPNVLNGEPLCGPYYTVNIRVRDANDDNAAIAYQGSHLVYIPQVQRFTLTDAAYDEFCEKVVFPTTYWQGMDPDFQKKVKGNLEFYKGYNDPGRTQKTQIEDLIIGYKKSLLPPSANIRITREKPKGRYKNIRGTTSIEYVSEFGRYELLDKYDITLGFVHKDEMKERNADPAGEGFVLVDKIKGTVCKTRASYDIFGWKSDASFDKDMFPLDYDNLAKAIASNGTHEFCHTVGLVSPKYLFGSSTDGNMWHDTTPDPTKSRIMNPSRAPMHIFDKGKGRNWNSWNEVHIKYLEFFFRKPK